MRLLHPWWITGYTDGEGSFVIKTTEAKTCAIGYTVRLIYQISVHPSDEAILHSLKAFFKGVGDIIYSEHYVAYRVSKLSDIIQFIIPHFDKYPLQSTKVVPYYLFKAVADLMVKREHITLPGFREMLTYKAAAKKGLEAKFLIHLKISLPTILKMYL